MYYKWTVAQFDGPNHLELWAKSVAIFLLETILKLTALGPKQYFADPWNMFDFSVVAISVSVLAPGGSTAFGSHSSRDRLTHPAHGRSRPSAPRTSPGSRWGAGTQRDDRSRPLGTIKGWSTLSDPPACHLSSQAQAVSFCRREAFTRDDQSCPPHPHAVSFWVGLGPFGSAAIKAPALCGY